MASGKSEYEGGRKENVVEGKGEKNGRWGKEKQGKGDKAVGKRKGRRFNMRDQNEMSFCTKLPGWMLQHISFVGNDRSQTFFALSSHVRELE